MNDVETKKDQQQGIPWHPAFVVALKATLIDYADDLRYELEHPLVSEPLRIDVLVIKKRPEAVIKKQIAEIFRHENIFEYKSPRKTLSVNEFHKAFARVHLYKALSDVKVSDLTLSFVVTKYPRELFRHLRNSLGYTVQERHPGVNVVTGAMIPIQVLITSKLSEEENDILRNLGDKMPEKNFRWMGKLEQKLGNRIDLGAYLYAVLMANQDKLSKEDYLMLTARTQKIFEEIGWGDKWRREGIEEGRLKAAKAMLAEGDSFAKIARVTEIPVKTLKRKLSNNGEKAGASAKK